MVENKKEYLFNILIFLPYLSFFLGFYLDENSAGAGSLKGDLTWIITNIKIFENNNLFTAISHPDLYGNRTPLVYILHELFNPFFHNIDHYRVSVFCISLFGPVAFYYCLKQKFKNIDNKLLIFISSIILLSPYYRTSSYWALNENYGLITVLLSFLFLQYFLENNKNNYTSYLQLFLTILFSSLCVYFDQKLIFVPIICFFRVLLLKKNIQYKVYMIISYLLLSLPFLYLVIFLWGGIVPPKSQEFNPNAITSLSRLNNLYFYHIGYATSMIAFYILPFLFLKNKNFYVLIKDFFKNHNNYFKISLCFIYIFFIFFFLDFKEYTIEEYFVGLGYVHKTSLLLFDNLLFQEFFTYLAFIISWIIILIYIDNNTKDFLIILYFYFLSLVTWPLMQEYFDPIIILLCFVALKSKIYINKKNSIFLISYLCFFLISANIYYFFKLS